MPCRNNEHISAYCVQKSHLEGGCIDGFDGAIFGEVYFVLAVVLDIRVNDLSLHGVEVVEVGAEGEQLVNIQI